jgi:hypothetical protein
MVCVGGWGGCPNIVGFQIGSNLITCYGENGYPNGPAAGCSKDHVAQIWEIK